MEGLLLCDMIDSSRGIILNFFELIERLGFVPNGSRGNFSLMFFEALQSCTFSDYYTKRTQPPLLTQMVRVYVEHSADVDFLSQALSYLDAEYSFWMTKFLSFILYSHFFFITSISLLTDEFP